MTDDTRNDTERFAALFEGHKNAYGTYEVKGVSDTGKQEGRAVTHSAPVTLEHYARHLRGEQGLGIVPIDADSMCWFAAIDDDEYGTAFSVIAKVHALGLPFLPCLSKSGGVHHYLFFAHAIPAVKVRVALAALASALGLKGRELFPKQGTLKPDEKGNWLNLPYFKGEVSPLSAQRLAVRPDTQEKVALLATFLDMAEGMRITEAQLDAVLERLSGARFSDGPPCLQNMAGRKLTDGEGRSNAMAHAVVYLKHKHGEAWLAHVQSANESLCAVPLTARELEATVVKSGKKNDYGYKCNDAPMAGRCDKALCQQRKYGINALVQDAEPPHEWGAPADVFTDALLVSPLPRGVLPQVVEDMAYGNPDLNPAAVAAACMAALSIAASDCVRLEVTDTWTVSFRLWYALVGPASAKKTPVTRLVLAALRKAQEQRWKEHQQDMRKWIEDGKEGEKPVCVRYLCDDATIEKLGDLMQHTPHGLGLVHDELSAVIAAMDGTYNESKESQRGHWLAAYDGGARQVDRVGRGEVYIPNMSVAILGGIPTDKLLRIVSRSVADGMMARIGITLVPASAPSADIASVPPEVRAAFDAVLERLLARRPDAEYSVRLTDDALRVFGASKKRWEIEALLFAERLPRYAERLGKLVGEAARLALGFALVDYAQRLRANGDAVMNDVDAATMERACAYASYQASHDAAFYQSAARCDGDPTIEPARRVAEWLLAHRKAEFQLGDVTRGVLAWRTLRSLDQLGALELLSQLGWIHADRKKYFEGMTFVRGTCWTVNPAIHTEYAERAENVRRMAAMQQTRLKDAVAKHKAARAVGEETDAQK